MLSKITEKQQNVLDFVVKEMEKCGYPPSLREICAEFSIKSPKNARKHLEALEKKGFIRRRAGKSRAIEIVKQERRETALAGRLSKYGGRTASEEERTVAIPVLGRVRAGSPALAVEDIEGYMRLDPDFFSCRGGFILRAEGESMTGAGIDDGDLLLIAPKCSAESGEIVIAMLDDEATVKRFMKKEGRIELLPENPAFSPVEIDPTRPFAIIGRVVNVIKNL